MIRGYFTRSGMVFISPFNIISDGIVVAHQGEMVLIDCHVIVNLTRAIFNKIQHKFDMRRGISCENPAIQ